MERAYGKRGAAAETGEEAEGDELAFGLREAADEVEDWDITSVNMCLRESKSSAYLRIASWRAVAPVSGRRSRSAGRGTAGRRLQWQFGQCDATHTRSESRTICKDKDGYGHRHLYGTRDVQIACDLECGGCDHRRGER